MVKDFETYINEDYFSKLANRKDTGSVRKENEVTEDIVKSFVNKYHLDLIKSININKSIVDIDGSLYLRAAVEEIPFQFGKVTGNFNCSYTNLKSLNGCPKEVGGDFVVRCCGKKFTEEEVKSLCDVKGRIFV